MSKRRPKWLRKETTRKAHRKLSPGDLIRASYLREGEDGVFPWGSFKVAHPRLAQEAEEILWVGFSFSHEDGTRLERV